MTVWADEERPLTARHLEVVRLMAEGLTDREIGVALGITVGTVKAHAQAILRRTHAHTRTQVVASCIRRGLI